jgi:hypothetical protein
MKLGIGRKVTVDKDFIDSQPWDGLHVRIKLLMVSVSQNSEESCNQVD